MTARDPSASLLRDVYGSVAVVFSRSLPWIRQRRSCDDYSTDPFMWFVDYDTHGFMAVTIDRRGLTVTNRMLSSGRTPDGQGTLAVTARRQRIQGRRESNSDGYGSVAVARGVDLAFALTQRDCCFRRAPVF